MSEVTKNSLEEILPQLKCHFTWNLLKKECVSQHLEDRVFNDIKFLSTEFKARTYNLLAYIKHLRGENEAALECLQQAEELIQQEHTDQAETGSLVTWGNYAWVYYHLGRLSEAQIYVDKVKHACKKLSNPYSIECPELDCEEGWTRIKCEKNERAKVCFEKALEEKPNNPEFSSGLAIASYYLDKKPQQQLSVNILKQAIELSPDNHYVKVLLALKLQELNEQAEGERLVKEALEKAPGQPDILTTAAKFYRKQGDLDKAIELFLETLELIPHDGYLYHQVGCCYRAKVKQMQNVGEFEANGNGEMIEELRKNARNYLNQALEKGLSPLQLYSNRIELLEAEECYQIACNKEHPDTDRQCHQHYCDLQEHNGKSEDSAVQHCLEEGLPRSKKTTENEEMKYQLQSIVENLPQDTPHSLYLQGLIHKLNGDLWQAAECYEKKLGQLLKNASSGIGHIFLSESELEDSSEETGQETGSPTSREPHNP